MRIGCGLEVPGLLIVGFLASGPGGALARTIETSVRIEGVKTSRFDETAEVGVLVAHYAEPFGESGSIGPALVVGWERRRDADGQADRLSEHYVGPALRLRRGWLTAQAEVRSVGYLAAQAPGLDHRPAIDGRLRLNRWRETEFPLKSLPLTLLTDSYLDAEWRPSLANDVVFTAFDRIGLRRSLGESFKLDLYAEPCVMLDARQSYEHNRLEWRSTLRLRWLPYSESLPVDLAVASVHNYDLPRGESPASPQRRSEFSQRLSLVIEGEL